MCANVPEDVQRCSCGEAHYATQGMVGGDYHGVVTLFLSHPHAMLGWHNCPFRAPL